MVSGLRRDASTMRNLSCPSDQREPVPVRSGDRSPWNRSSGKGPEWQSRHVFCRLITIARPRAESPRSPVSECGMESPATVNGRSGSCALAKAPLPNNASAIAVSRNRCRMIRPGMAPAALQPPARYRHAKLIFSFFNGKFRMRFPVALKYALSTAGAATQIVGSPMPPQIVPPDGMMIDSTFGISEMRMEL